jgi:MATE family multidrug resistance protein
MLAVVESEDEPDGDGSASFVAASDHPRRCCSPGGWLVHEACAELKIIAWMGWPNSLNAAVSYLPKVLTLVVLTDLDEIAAAGMGQMWCNVSGLSLIVGFGTALGPLVSQAYGAGNHARAGDLLQRQLWLHLIWVCLPIALLWWCTAPVLRFLGQPQRIVALTSRFVVWRIPALPAIALRRDLETFLQSQRVMRMPMLVGFAASALNIALLWLFLRVARIGYVGAPLALTLSNVAQAAALFLLAPKVSCLYVPLHFTRILLTV